jgi:hypothetical protein
VAAIDWLVSRASSSTGSTPWVSGLMRGSRRGLASAFPMQAISEKLFFLLVIAKWVPEISYKQTPEINILNI